MDGLVLGEELALLQIARSTLFGDCVLLHSHSLAALPVCYYTLVDHIYIQETHACNVISGCLIPGSEIPNCSCADVTRFWAVAVTFWAVLLSLIHLWMPRKRGLSSSNFPIFPLCWVCLGRVGCPLPIPSPEGDMVNSLPPKFLKFT